MATSRRLSRSVRVTFTVSIEENPGLTEALLGAQKGRRRRARVIALASMGLIAEATLVLGRASASAQPSLASGAPHGEASSADDEVQILADEDFECLEQQ